MIRPGVQRSTVAGPQKNKNSEKKKEDTNLDCVWCSIDRLLKKEKTSKIRREKLEKKAKEMEKVMNMIKPKPNPQQLLRDWQRKLRQECRNIERQIRGN